MITPPDTESLPQESKLGTSGLGQQQHQTVMLASLNCDPQIPAQSGI